MPKITLPASTTTTTRTLKATPEARTTDTARTRDLNCPADARDRALLTAHRAGDRTALPELLESYQDRLFSVCMRMVNCPEIASDLTQEAMVKIIQGLDAFAGRSKLSTWMIRVTMNVCLTHRRRQRLRNHLSIDLPAAGSSVSSVEGTATIADSLPYEREQACDETVERREARHRLYRAMDRLEPAARAILILRDVQELDYAQIADVLQIPQGTVKSRLFRARTALREQIERIGGGRV